MKRRTFLKSVAAGSALAIPGAVHAQDNSTPIAEGTTMTTTTLETGYAPVNGLEIYYEIHGEDRGNTPLLVMHGSYMTIDSMLAFIGPMAATRQVIAFEAQGHGRTADLPDRELTYENMADDAAGLLDHLGVAQADVSGYSLGACTAIRVAIRHPEKVRKLVPIAGTFRLDGWDPRVREMIATITPDMFMETPFYEEYFRLAPRPEDWPTFVEKLVAIDTTVPQDIPVEVVQAIAAPALVIAGDQDSSTPQHTVELFIALGGGTPGDLGLPVPKAQLAILPNTTHIQLLFVPEPAINAIVPPFLDAPMPDEATPAA
ncbi:MAG: alpha/beta hydrolase [Chloroflexota bacterium]|nr:alpha/beta hydrolase [Chloroflexota bacterium]